MSTFGISGCTDCVVYRDCGGHHLPLVSKLGCANFANSMKVDTDDMNPCFQERFWKLWKDTDGLLPHRARSLVSMRPEGLPTYIPLLQNKYMKRARSLDVPIVALKLFDVLKKPRGGVYAPRFTSPASLRAGYRLRPDTKIVLSGVDFDSPLETFWAEHQISHVCEAISQLDTLGVTVPNYSFFMCAPRFQILRNRKRIILAAERLSSAGVPVSLHIHGNTPYDWEFWLDFLKDHTEISSVTLEFQSGPRLSAEITRESFNYLLRIRDGIGRPLHVFMVGAARLYKDLMLEFPSSFSVIDSHPFMKAVAREVLVKDAEGNLCWQKQHTKRGDPLDDIIETNILNYPELLALGLGDESEPLPVSSRQCELNWLTSIPNLTAQPVA